MKMHQENAGPETTVQHDRAFWMVRGVARALGLNLAQEMAEGRMCRGQYCAMIENCLNHACLDRCGEWLGHTPGQASEPPPGCANAQAFAKIAQRTC